MNFITLNIGNLCLELCCPGTYYQGTRFDWSAVFRRISKGGYVFADEWFSTDDPKVHDHVCGPSEEFLTVSFEDVKPGEVFVKPGVGLLRRPDDAPYDWFRLYEIADAGEWTLTRSDTSAIFRQVLKGFYDYEKEVAIVSDDCFEIRHRLGWSSLKALHGHCYNHNFFTFGDARTDAGRLVDFPFQPCGDWRSEYDNVALSGRGIRFSGPVVPPQPSVYMGNLHDAAGENPYSFRISEGDASVEVRAFGAYGLSADSLLRFSKMVFWANPRVACIEPYLPVSLRAGETVTWTIRYRLKAGE